VLILPGRAIRGQQVAVLLSESKFFSRLNSTDHAMLKLTSKGRLNPGKREYPSHAFSQFHFSACLDQASAIPVV